MMKTEQETQISFEYITLNLITQKENNMKCIQGNDAYEYCTNQNCSQQKIFQCQSRKCKCRSNHKSCLKADVGYTLQIINSKINDTSSIKSSIQNSFDQLIDQLSQIRDSMINLIDQRLKYHGLHNIEKLFLKSISQDLDSTLTSKQAAKLWSAINGKLAPNYNVFQEITAQLQKFHKNMNSKSQSLDSSIKKIFQKQEMIQGSNGVENLKIENALKIYSSIVTEDEQIQRLKEMFTKKVQKGQLLLKASEVEFEIKQYFDLYGKETDVMIICKTQKDKIIGGYTPLSFFPGPSEQGFVADDSKESFIFSLTENDKFELKEDKKAIYRDYTKTILTFGNAEFEICDKANEVKKSCTYLTNQSYSNPNYTENTDSFLKLNGNEHEEFLVKQWQVWKIRLQIQQE